MNNTQVELTPEELEVVVSALLFTSSVSVIGTIDEERQQQLINLAKKLKNNDPSMKLKFVEFLKEEEYEDSCSHQIYEEFKNNIDVVSFSEV